MVQESQASSKGKKDGKPIGAVAPRR